MRSIRQVRYQRTSPMRQDKGPRGCGIERGARREARVVWRAEPEEFGLDWSEVEKRGKVAQSGGSRSGEEWRGEERNGEKWKGRK
ncbi:hypothetical protein Pmani_007528 [Petrolisthes manimaculis]|uniref:Uncharacterized protein n=1 Tax=Petrolisthes manimaculis TaxID=1843537 RepID=A0AAE1UIM8_9EUCA|nr:hypothetical protein Pmani_007528 [Petrolisthes manimaculis]